MLLYVYKMGGHWYFRFVVKMANIDNRDVTIISVTESSSIPRCGLIY